MTERPKILLVVRTTILDEEKILLIKRSQDDRWEPGKWEIPGGKLDFGQSVLKVIQREVKEETGLAIEVGRSEIFTFSDKKTIRSGRYRGYYYLALIFKTSNFSGKLRVGPEHESSRWVTLGEALDLKLTGETRKIIEFLMKCLGKIWGKRNS